MADRIFGLPSEFDVYVARNQIRHNTSQKNFYKFLQIVCPFGYLNFAIKIWQKVNFPIF